MSRILLVVPIVLLFQFSLARAQEETADKRHPAPRQLDLPLSQKDSSSAVQRSPMPKIDLPEYTITGKVAIDLPEAEKQPAPEDSQSTDVVSMLNPSLMRSRGTAQSAEGNKEDIERTNVQLFNGKAFASLGTFFSPQAGVWFGQTVADYLYSLGGQYYRTKGFAPYTDRSGGSADLQGGTRLKSYNPYFDQTRLYAELAYKSDTYNWYGTSDPRVSRNRVNVDFSAGLSNWDQSPIPYRGEVGFQNFTVSDSSQTVVETLFRLNGTTRMSVFAVPLNFALSADGGGVSYGGSSSGLSYFDVSAGSQRYTWKELSWEATIHGYFAHSMDDQTIVRLYPHLDAAYPIGDGHTLSATYAPAVEAASLSSQVFANRYIAAMSKIKNTDDQQDVTLALESDWSMETSTRFAVRVQSMKDYPLYADSLSRGVWLLAYGGRTTIASFSGEVFAKLPANDYFAARIVASVSNNSLTGTSVPYLPVFEVGASYIRQFFRRWTGTVELTLVHERKDNVVDVNSLPSILLIGLRCEYGLLEQVAVFFDVQNLLNEQYEYWKGYQEDPFVLSAGVSLRW